MMPSRSSNEPVSDATSVATGRVIAADGASTEKNEVRVVTAVAAVDEEAQQQAAWRMRKRCQYRIASFVLLAIALLATVGTFVAAAIVMHHCVVFREPNSDSSILYVLGSFMLYLFVCIESFACGAALTVITVKLGKDASTVLLRAPYDEGKHRCLCISVFVLFLLSLYSLVVPIIIVALHAYPKEPVALCVMPAVRAIALLAFFAVLIAHRRV